MGSKWIGKRVKILRLCCEDHEPGVGTVGIVTHDDDGTLFVELGVTTDAVLPPVEGAIGGWWVNAEDIVEVVG